MDGDLGRALNRAMIDVLGYKAGPLKRRLKVEYRPSWAMMPAGEAIVFWLRNNLPDDADRILDRAHAIQRASQPQPAAFPLSGRVK